ncbi:MAG: amidohydrolase family protein, partial [Blautia sp.]|nr:amidohydrolase family protein [Blautia sp.]
MIIDIHTHTFPDKIASGVVEQLGQKAHIRYFSDATNGQLAASMRKAGIDYSLVLPVATAARQVEKLNTASAQLNEWMAEEGILSFGCMHPEYEGYYAELDRVASLGIKGIKIHPVYQGVDIDDIRFLRIIDRAAELGLIVLTHAGLDVGFPGEVRCSPQMCRHVVDEIGDFPFILAHMGG